jgi:hypothetical protein
MRVVEAKIQTVEDMYSLIWTAIANKQPISAIYKERNRLFCPHRLGRNRLGQRRVLCYQYGGESESGLAPAGSPENWRCVVFEKRRRVELLNGSWTTGPATCVVDADIDAEDQPELDPPKER